MSRNLSTFCVLPWMHRFTNVGGEIQVCCTSEEFDNNIKHADGTPMKAPQDLDDEKIMNSQFMNQLRLDLLNGVWPSFCQRCESTENNGGISRRQIENDGYQKDIEELLQNTNSDGSLKEIKIKSLDIRTGNLCNLACRMCNPRSSSKWINEWHNYTILPYRMYQDLKKEYLSYDWYKTDQMKIYFKESSSHINHLHFAGGEPLIAKEMVQFLEECVANGRASEITLSYNTNITRLDSKIKELWPKFKGIKLLCSIDAYGELNEIIRSPSKWSDIHQNLLYLEEHFEELGLEEVLVMCTVQALNIFNLPDLYNYLFDNFKKIKPVPHLIDLFYPDYYQSQIFPAELKRIATIKLTEILDISYKRLPPELHFHLETLKGTINFLNAEDKTSLLKKFYHLTKEKDFHRKENVFQIVPELKLIKLNYENFGLREAKESKSFCTLPFSQLSIQPNGETKNCSIQNTSIQNSDLENLDVKKAPLENIWNSRSQKELRTFSLHGDNVHECHTCLEKEKNNQTSKRLDVLKNIHGTERLESSINQAHHNFGKVNSAPERIIIEEEISSQLYLGNKSIVVVDKNIHLPLQIDHNILNQLFNNNDNLKNIRFFSLPEGLINEGSIKNFIDHGCAKSHLEVRFNNFDSESLKKIQKLTIFSHVTIQINLANINDETAFQELLSNYKQAFFHLRILAPIDIFNLFNVENGLNKLIKNQENMKDFDIFFDFKNTATSFSLETLPQELRREMRKNLHSILSQLSKNAHMTGEQKLLDHLSEDVPFTHPSLVKILLDIKATIETTQNVDLFKFYPKLIDAIHIDAKKYQILK